MRISQKKLEEFMYLSLIAEYDYMQLNGNEKLIAFVGSRVFCDEIVKPICVTSTKLCSDVITTLRISKMEERLLKGDCLLDRLKKEQKLSFTKRIKLFIDSYYRNEVVFELYKNNINTLKICEVLDETQREGAIQYVDNIRKKIFEANYEIQE